MASLKEKKLNKDQTLTEYNTLKASSSIRHFLVQTKVGNSNEHADKHPPNANTISPNILHISSL